MMVTIGILADSNVSLGGNGPGTEIKNRPSGPGKQQGSGADLHRERSEQGETREP
jgi:hypothetical protein